MLKHIPASYSRQSLSRKVVLHTIVFLFTHKATAIREVEGMQLLIVDRFIFPDFCLTYRYAPNPFSMQSYYACSLVKGVAFNFFQISSANKSARHRGK